MCCFSGKVESVKNTRIFARMGAAGNQMLIYEMAVSAKQDVAMVLPIPVKAGSGEKAVNFFDLQGYKTVFDDLANGFPRPRAVAPASRSPDAPLAALPTLAVVAVGAFDASYVPTIADFSRLDERFRLPEQVWDKLPGYRDFGFVVYKLKLASGRFHAHPMAFSFPTARPGDVFFPTLHIHDGEIHERENFDHILYCQAPADADMKLWQESPRPAVTFAKCDLTHGMVQPDQHVFRRAIRGSAPNGDIVVKPRAA